MKINRDKFLSALELPASICRSKREFHTLRLSADFGRMVIKASAGDQSATSYADCDGDLGEVAVNPQLLHSIVEFSAEEIELVRDGEVLDPASADSRVRGVRALFKMIVDEPRLSATAVQTVGAKKWDGFVLAVVETV